MNLFLEQPPKNWAKKIQEEWRILEKDLPGEFVSVFLLQIAVLFFLPYPI